VVLLLVIDVFMRSTFNRTLPGTVELVELFMVVVVFMAVAYASLGNANVAVELLYSKLPTRTQEILDSFTSLLGALIFGFVSWGMGKRLLENLFSVTPLETSMLRIPWFPFLFIACFGSVLLCLELVIKFIHSLMKIRQGNH
jgi:TRAP-type C4-dicarboxylate transport system permease small subunit